MARFEVLGCGPFKSPSLGTTGDAASSVGYTARRSVSFTLIYDGWTSVCETVRTLHAPPYSSARTCRHLEWCR